MLLHDVGMCADDHLCSRIDPCASKPFLLRIRCDVFLSPMRKHDREIPCGTHLAYSIRGRRTTEPFAVLQRLEFVVTDKREWHVTDCLRMDSLAEGVTKVPDACGIKILHR